MKTIAQRLEHLQNIQDCIRQCQQYIDGDNRDIFKYSETWVWLGIDKHVKEQIEFRGKVIDKLSAFFAKKCMELAIEAMLLTKQPLLTDISVSGVHITEDDLSEVNL